MKVISYGLGAAGGGVHQAAGGWVGEVETVDGGVNLSFSDFIFASISHNNCLISSESNQASFAFFSTSDLLIQL